MNQNYDGAYGNGCAARFPTKTDSPEGVDAMFFPPGREIPQIGLEETGRSYPPQLR